MKYFMWVQEPTTICTDVWYPRMSDLRHWNPKMTHFRWEKSLFWDYFGLVSVEWN